jgi:hypothetical protein
MRRSSWTPLIVPKDREVNVLVDNSGRGITYRDPVVAEVAQFRDPTPVAYFPTLERRSEEEVNQRRSDIAISVGAAFALALPAILGSALYLAVDILLRAS